MLKIFSRLADFQIGQIGQLPVLWNHLCLFNSALLSIDWRQSLNGRMAVPRRHGARPWLRPGQRSVLVRFHSTAVVHRLERSGVCRFVAIAQKSLVNIWQGAIFIMSWFNCHVNSSLRISQFYTFGYNTVIKHTDNLCSYYTDNKITRLIIRELKISCISNRNSSIFLNQRNNSLGPFKFTGIKIPNYFTL